MKKNDLLQTAKALILGLLLAVGATALHAWTGPSGSPTTPNVAAPLNVTGSVQGKLGGLGLGYSGTLPASLTGNSPAKLDVNGVSSLGNLLVVGNSTIWGKLSVNSSTAPVEALDVGGAILATGLGSAANSGIDYSSPI